MKKLSDEEKAILQEEIARARTGRTGHILALDRPPLSAGRVIGEFIASGLGIFAGWVVFGILEAIFGFSDSVQLLLFIIILLPSAATPVYLIGTSGNETGSYLATLAGSIFAPIGCVVGFNITRRYKSPRN
jgi:hypothetical protein